MKNLKYFSIEKELLEYEKNNDTTSHEIIYYNALKNDDIHKQKSLE
jgi:hypothetical protein